MPVKFPAVVRVDDAFALFDEINEFARCAELPILCPVERAPQEWARDAARKKWVRLGVGRPNLALIGACGL